MIKNRKKKNIMIPAKLGKRNLRYELKKSLNPGKTLSIFGWVADAMQLLLFLMVAFVLFFFSSEGLLTFIAVVLLFSELIVIKREALFLTMLRMLAMPLGCVFWNFCI